MRCLQAKEAKNCYSVYQNVGMININNAWVAAITVCGSKLYRPIACVPITVITNPSFETGDLTGWSSGWGSSTIDVVTTAPHIGNYCVKCHSVGNAAAFVQQLITTRAGVSYTIYVWYKGDGGFILTVDNPSNTWLPNTSLSPAANWTSASCTFTAISNYTSIFFQTEQADNRIVYFDDVSVVVGS